MITISSLNLTFRKTLIATLGAWQNWATIIEKQNDAIIIRFPKISPSFSHTLLSLHLQALHEGVLNLLTVKHGTIRAVNSNKTKVPHITQFTSPGY